MERKLILKSQSNDVFEMIKIAELDHSSFQWKEIIQGGSLVSQLVHIPTAYYFIFDYLDSGHWSVFSPGVDRPLQYQSTDSWRECLYDSVAIWVRSLKREVESPTLWDNILGAKSLSDIVFEDTDNSQFSDKEITQVQTSLTEIKAYISSLYLLSKEQEVKLDARFAYLEKAAARLGRLDWRNAFAGALTGYFLDAVLSSDQMRDIAAFAWSLLKTVFLQADKLLK